MKPVIICGGIGSKMWPASRVKTPKQFLPLIGGKSLFQLNWESLRKKFEAKDIYIQTTREQADMVRIQVPEVLVENVFVEPEMKNHGPATGFAAAMLYRVSPDEPFMLVQVDDLRLPEEEFYKMMDVCDRLARETNKYITGGHRPDFAITGNDWLIKGGRVSEENEVPVYDVKEFLWRGDGENAKVKAEEYYNAGLALLHMNHTCMTPRNFLEMYKKYRMEWFSPLMAIAEGGDADIEYAKMPKGPIEDVTQLVYRAGEALVVELPFKWIDIGTWESFISYQLSVNSYQLDGLEIGAKNNFAVTKKYTAFIGVDDLVVVETDDALLICKKDQSGRVGEVVEKLKAEGKTNLL